MSKLFGNFVDDPRMERQALLSKFNAARTNLLLLIAFSAINLIMLATGSGTYFLFSASIPYLLTDLAMFFCGMYPEEFYKDFEGMVYLDKSFFVIMLIISLLILVLYLLCWLFSKKNKVGWLVGALVMFGIDTLVMFGYYGFSADMIIDIVFHVWVIVILAMGISAHYKLKKMPVEETVIEGEFTELPTDESAVSEEPVAEKPVTDESGNTEVETAEAQIEAPAEESAENNTETE